MKTRLLTIDPFSFFFFLSLPQVSADVTKSVGTGVDYALLNAAFEAIIAGAIKTGSITIQKTINSTECFGNTQRHFSVQTVKNITIKLPANSDLGIGFAAREKQTERLFKNSI